MKSLSLGQPHAIVMVGIPGSGKSFFAEKFADTFNAPYIEAAFYRHLASDDKAASQLIAHTVSQLAKTKQSMVLEIDTDARTSRTELEKDLKKLGYSTLFVWVQTDLATAASRSQKAYNMSKYEHDDRVKRFSPPHESEKALVISGKHTYSTQARIVLKRLSGAETGRAESSTARKSVPERSSTNIVLR